jgi:hypothetical protein
MKKKLPRNSFRANPLEVKVLNYIIKETLAGKDFDEIDHSYVGYATVRGKADMWKGFMGQIRKQLQVNPNDIDGYSIVPIWVREVYQLYRQSDYHDCWQPGKMNLESVETLEHDVIKVEPPKPEVEPINQVLKDFYIGFKTLEDDANCKISIIPFKDKSKDFYVGYLKAKYAKKIYKITLEETDEYNEV